MSETARTGGAYRTLDEQREISSAAEERFERSRQTLGLFVGPVAFLVVYFAPLEPARRTFAAIPTFAIAYRLSEAVPIAVTAILAPATCVVFGYHLFVYRGVHYRPGNESQDGPLRYSLRHHRILLIVALTSVMARLTGLA